MRMFGSETSGNELTGNVVGGYLAMLLILLFGVHVNAMVRH